MGVIKAALRWGELGAGKSVLILGGPHWAPGSAGRCECQGHRGQPRFRSLRALRPGKAPLQRTPLCVCLSCPSFLSRSAPAARPPPPPLPPPSASLPGPDLPCPGCAPVFRGCLQRPKSRGSISKAARAGWRRAEGRRGARAGQHLRPWRSGGWAGAGG